MENKEKGSFVGSVLLSSPVWDAEKLKKDLLDEWNISVPDEEEADNDTIVFEADNYMVAISLMPAPVPAGEAEYYAKSNYFW